MHEELLDLCKGKNLTGQEGWGRLSERGGGFPSLEGCLLRWERGAGMVCPLRIAKPECGGSYFHNGTPGLSFPLLLQFLVFFILCFPGS